MTYSIRVQKTPEYLQASNPDLLVKNFNSFEEFNSVFSLCDNKVRISYFESLIIPMRTDNLGNLCKDFIAPGLFNEALKANSLKNKIFLSLYLGLIDLATLPLRLITVVPKYIYNTLHPKEAHPFYQYLLNNGVAAADLKAGHVYLEIKTTEKNKIGGAPKLTTRGVTFNFMHLPESIGSTRTEFKKINAPT